MKKEGANLGLTEKEIRLIKKRTEVELLKKELGTLDFWKKEIEKIYKKSLEPKTGIGDLQLELKTLLERITNRISVLTKMIRELG